MCWTNFGHPAMRFMYWNIMNRILKLSRQKKIVTIIFFLHWWINASLTLHRGNSRLLSEKLMRFPRPLWPRPIFYIRCVKASRFHSWFLFLSFLHSLSPFISFCLFLLPFLPLFFRPFSFCFFLPNACSVTVIFLQLSPCWSPWIGQLTHVKIFTSSHVETGAGATPWRTRITPTPGSANAHCSYWDSSKVRVQIP